MLFGERFTSCIEPGHAPHFSERKALLTYPFNTIRNSFNALEEVKKQWIQYITPQ